MRNREKWLSLLGGLLFVLSTACSGNKDCSNGECACQKGAVCEFTCESPPCHVNCEGDNPSCTGTCGNASCTCGVGSSCEFSCETGPCHVNCEGSNSSCAGTCANGTCTCGAGSDCTFDCLDDNCKFNCEGSCTVACRPGMAGETCQINHCAGGTPTVCADGVHVVCGTPCPSPKDETE